MNSEEDLLRRITETKLKYPNLPSVLYRSLPAEYLDREAQTRCCGIQPKAVRSKPQLSQVSKFYLNKIQYNYNNSMIHLADTNFIEFPDHAAGKSLGNYSRIPSLVSNFLPFFLYSVHEALGPEAGQEYYTTQN